MFSKTLILTILPFLAEARIGDQQRQLTSKDNRECTAVPLRVRSNGEGVYFDSMYVAAYYEPGNSPVLSTLELCDAFMSAYNNQTICGALPGSFTEIGACQVLLDAEGPVNTNLMKLEVFANTVDGDVLYSPPTSEVPEVCNCQCGTDQETIIGVYLSNSCNCFCEPQDFDCNCITPTEDATTSKCNEMYSAAVESTIEFTMFPQLELLDIFDCDTNITQYNSTSVCPGLQSEAFSSLTTPAPSATPTASPTDAPTEFPSEFPSEFPTEFPTLSPTESVEPTPQ